MPTALAPPLPLPGAPDANGLLSVPVPATARVVRLYVQRPNGAVELAEAMAFPASPAPANQNSLAPASATVAPTVDAVNGGLAATSTADRARANHTGTQLANTISNFGTATQAVLDADKALPGRTATIDPATGKVYVSLIPGQTREVLPFATLAAFPATGDGNALYIARDAHRSYIWDGSGYTAMDTGAVTSVAGRTGNVVLRTDDVSEGSTNQYFTGLRAIGALLTGYLKLPNRAIAATDPIATAIGILETRADDNTASISQLIATTAARFAPVVVQTGTTIIGYATLDEALAVPPSSISITLNTAVASITASPTRVAWPNYFNGNGSSVTVNDGTVTKMPPATVQACTIVNSFFFKPTGGAGTGKFLFQGAFSSGVTSATCAQLLYNYCEVVLQLSGDTLALTGGYYASLTGTGTVYLFGNVQVDAIAAGITVVDKRVP